MKHLAHVILAITLAVATALGGYAINDAAGADASPVLGPGLVTVNADIHYSKFSMSTLRVREGTTVQFVIRNNDPIDHEFIVGDAGVHRRHRLGTHPAHPPVPGEVSLPAGAIGATFYRFDEPGKYLFACHLPGHVAFGIRGWIEVEPV